MKTSENIIFFDGVCNLCHHSVSFVINKDHKKIFKYSSLQGSLAHKVLDQKYIQEKESVILLSGQQVYIKSEAAVHILIKLGGVYKILGKVLSVFPYRFLNVFYDLIAKNRYSLFGKQPTCRLPTKEESQFFID